MIFWNEYKNFKAIAEKCLDNKMEAPTIKVEIKVLEYSINQISRADAIEWIINSLSNGKHFEDNNNSYILSLQK